MSGRGFTTPVSCHARYSTKPSASSNRGTRAPRYQKEVDRDDFLWNNKCAVVGKALQTGDSYQSLLDWWREQDDPDRGKPTPPSTDKTGAYSLGMAHTEGYRLTVDDDMNRVQFRITPKSYKKVKGNLCGEPDAMDELRDAITSDEVDVGQAELLYRDGVYYLHVTVTREFDVPEPNTADTMVGVDINEHTVALTALDRETMRTKGTLVLDYERVKQERQRYHTITTRCQEHGKTSIHRKSVRGKNDSPSGYSIVSPVLSWSSQSSSRSRSSCSRIWKVSVTKSRTGRI